MHIKKLSQIIFAVAVLAASSQVSFAQGKSKLVYQLVQLTIVDFPSAELRLPFQEKRAKLAEAMKAEIIERYPAFIDAQEKFNAQQKANLKKHLPELAEDVSWQTTANYLVTFSNNLMIGECLRETYQNFSVAELNKMIGFLKTPAGKSYVKVLGELLASKIEKTEIVPNTQKKYENQIERFNKSSAGDKFMKAFVVDSISLFHKKANAYADSYFDNLDPNHAKSVIADFMNKYSK